MPHNSTHTPNSNVGLGRFDESSKDPNYIEKWLKNGDEVKMEIEGLGSITNKITEMNSNHSLLKLKK